MSQPIEGIIVKILDDYNVVTNLGWKDGLADGMGVVVFTSEGEELKDPNTNESLGCLELVKARLKVMHVQEKCSLCVAENSGKGAVGESGGIKTLGAAMMAEAMGQSTGSSTEKLNVSTSQISGMPQVGPISVGDKVRCMLEK